MVFTPLPTSNSSSPHTKSKWWFLTRVEVNFHRMVSIICLISGSSFHFFLFLGTVPKAVNTIYITDTIMFFNFPYRWQFLHIFTLLSFWILLGRHNMLDGYFFYSCRLKIIWLSELYLVIRFNLKLPNNLMQWEMLIWAFTLYPFGENSVSCTIPNRSSFTTSHVHSCLPFVLVCCIYLCDCYYHISNICYSLAYYQVFFL